MYRLKKIIKTIAIFIFIVMLICVLYSFQRVLNSKIEISQMTEESFKYFLYTIGYGSAVEGEDSVSQNIFAMIGIISIALMSTFLTLNLFWRGDDVKISKKIAIWKKRNEYYASILFLNKGTNICDLKINFISYDSNGNIIQNDEKEYTYPLLVKKSYWRYDVSLKNLFWYNSLKTITQNDIIAYIYLTFSFVDTKTGQTTIKVIKFGKEDLIGLENIKDFVINNKTTDSSTKLLKELNDSLFENVIRYDISKLEPITFGGDLKLLYNKEEACEELEISFPKKAKDYDFVIPLIYNKNSVDRYYTKNAIFRCMVSGDEGIKYITLEIKRKDGMLIMSKKIEVKDEPTLYEFRLETNSLRDEDENNEIYLQNIKEICFTVFKKDMLMNKAKVKIYKAEIDTVSL